MRTLSNPAAGRSGHRLDLFLRVHILQRMRRIHGRHLSQLPRTAIAPASWKGEVGGLASAFDGLPIDVVQAADEAIVFGFQATAHVGHADHFNRVLTMVV